MSLNEEAVMMMQTMTRGSECSAAHLLVAFELGQEWWKVGFTTGIGARPSRRRIAAGDVTTLRSEMARAKGLFGLPSDAAVISCYEAGRDGFWLHRYLTAQGVTNHVIDSASIEVNRRARRSKTDALDLVGLLNLLARYVAGDRRCWRVVRVPSLAAEDARQLHRTIEVLQGDRTRVINRLKAVLATLGVRPPIQTAVLAHLDDARLWDGAAIPPGARQRLESDGRQLQAIDAELAAARAARDRLPVDVETTTGRYVHTLQQLRAIGPVGGWVLATEIFGWREIRNARQLGALVGLVPARYQSGTIQRDLGITRAGNTHVRRVMVQLAWGWVRYQPHSALSQWYQQRFGHGGPRMRRVGIVAVARKLLIALWRYVEADVLPEGAVLKPVAA